MEQEYDQQPIFVRFWATKSGRPYKVKRYPSKGHRSQLLPVLKRSDAWEMLQPGWEQFIYCQGFAAGHIAGLTAGLSQRDELLAALVVEEGFTATRLSEVTGLNRDYVRKRLRGQGLYAQDIRYYRYHPRRRG